MDIVLAIVRDQALQAIVLLALIAALVDFTLGVLTSLADHTFTLAKIADFLTTHVLFKAIPIIFSAFLASSVGAVVQQMGTIPAAITAIIDAAWIAAWAGLVAYLALVAKGLSDRIAAPDKQLLP